ncbi:MAG: polysaccharide biosynthesis protein [Paludibacteraceae bacterium]|nr:polysaccharide biosynthesis protein [Paludibacteraceae bacterium]
MDTRENEKRKLEHWQVMAVCLMICDVISVCLAYFLALWLRFDCVYSHIPVRYLSAYTHFAVPYAVCAIILFWIFNMYRGMWRYASYTELIRTFGGSMTASFLHSVFITVFYLRMPLSYYIWGAGAQFVFLLLPRFAYRLLLFYKVAAFKNRQFTGRVMIIGAGQTGQMLLRDISTTDEMNDKVVCFIDDNKNKWNRYIESVPIVGGREDILSAVEKYKVNKIYYAISSAPPEDKKEILGICSEAGCELKQIPGMAQLAMGRLTVSAMKDVAIEDLLGREPIRVDLTEVFHYIHGKVVMVTGGGGSIGSELCRQIAAHDPKQLIIFDIYENNAYSIQLELKRKYPNLKLETLIGSVRDSRRLMDVFAEYRPQIVYHAAAHKHVPLMEDSPCEAIKNNAIGTYKTAYAAMLNGCERFVLISTDKAVNPTNIMGASKRLCEMIVQSFDKKIKQNKAAEIPQLFTHVEDIDVDPERAGDVFRGIKTEFVAVRFGNVLGSNGSVIPIFKRQIEEGGPVTVTHPDIIRYFMTVSEAVSLVMLAGTYARGGEIFVLDMGSPVKIDTLARNLIKLSGFKPDVDIKIVYSGLRPGEKLYEEKLMAEEGLRKTDNDLIHIGCPIPFDTDTFLQGMNMLMTAAYRNEKDIRSRVADLVQTYHPANPEVTIVKDAKYVALV